MPLASSGMFGLIDGIASLQSPVVSAKPSPSSSLDAVSSSMMPSQSLSTPSESSGA